MAPAQAMWKRSPDPPQPGLCPPGLAQRCPPGPAAPCPATRSGCAAQERSPARAPRPRLEPAAPRDSPAAASASAHLSPPGTRDSAALGPPRPLEAPPLRRHRPLTSARGTHSRRAHARGAAPYLRGKAAGGSRPRGWCCSPRSRPCIPR